MNFMKDWTSILGIENPKIVNVDLHNSEYELIEVDFNLLKFYNKDKNLYYYKLGNEIIESDINVNL